MMYSSKNFYTTVLMMHLAIWCTVLKSSILSSNNVYFSCTLYSIYFNKVLLRAHFEESGFYTLDEYIII